MWWTQTFPNKNSLTLKRCTAGVGASTVACYYLSCNGTVDFKFIESSDQKEITQWNHWLGVGRP